MTSLQVVSVIIVLRSKNNYLLVQRNPEDKIFPGKWQNVGGKIEPGERVEEAIKREVKEEVGLSIDGRPYFLMSYSWKKDINEPHRLGLIFLIDLIKSPSSLKVRINKELCNYKWLKYKEIEKMNESNLLIGKDSPTGTFEQIKVSAKI